MTKKRIRLFNWIPGIRLSEINEGVRIGAYKIIQVIQVTQIKDCEFVDYVILRYRRQLTFCHLFQQNKLSINFFLGIHLSPFGTSGKAGKAAKYWLSSTSVHYIKHKPGARVQREMRT